MHALVVAAAEGGTEHADPIWAYVIGATALAILLVLLLATLSFGKGREHT